ncbi:hypothetical protein PG993_012163 [Apiospora rasikravindrae]|uniref:Uncharacterized protein n=1 Tax=Apiospora rasikravindrae TaxID=990691 RepID=A0ABR1S318_9PEZI
MECHPPCGSKRPSKIEDNDRGHALSPPEKVQRADGSRVVIKAEKSVMAECRALWQVCKRRDVLLLPIFWAAYFNQYAGSFQTYYFGIRARALIGFVSNFGTLLSSQLISALLDYHLALKPRFCLQHKLSITGTVHFYWDVVHC